MAYTWEDWSKVEVCREGGRRWAIVPVGDGYRVDYEDADDLDAVTVELPEIYPSRWAAIEAAEQMITKHLGVTH